MCKEELDIKLSPKEILHILEEKIKRLNRIHREFYTLEKNTVLYVVVYEFLFLRNSSSGTITLLLEDHTDWTTVKIIVSEVKGGILSHDDYLASEDACFMIKKLLHEYIVSQKTLI
ncbi:MAG: hypothetical protein IJ471_03045 [Eubacterium sp.]|nr:hypothetical protein [Eubacterium sp.]